MTKFQVTSGLIKSFANQDNNKYVKKVNKIVNSVLAQSIDSLSHSVSYINLKNVVLQPVNELLNGGFVDNSSYVYLLGVNNAQLDINTSRQTNFLKNIKNRLYYAWKNRRKTRKKHRFRKRRHEEKENKEVFDPAKYNIYNLTADLQNSIINFISETSLVELQDNCLRIRGKDDFGSSADIVIYLTLHVDNVFKFFIPNKRYFVQIDINNRIAKLEKKIEAAGDNFIKMIKVFNALYYNINGYMPNQTYIESVLCYCPENLFKASDIYKVYLKIINYLSLTTLRNIPSINDSTLNINEDDVCGHCGIGFSKILKTII